MATATADATEAGRPRGDEAPRTALIISAFFPPWGGVGALRTTKLVKYLPEFGWTPRVLASDEARLELRDDTLLADIPGDVIVSRIRGPFRWLGGASGGAVAAWRAGRARGPLGLVKGAMRAFAVPDRWAGWSLRVGGLSSATLGRVDVVVSSGPPHSSHFAAARIARRLSVPFVMDMRDDWSENPMHASSAPWHAPLEQVMERWCVARADRVVAVSDAAAQRMAERYPDTREKFVAIPNGFDPDDLPRTSATEIDRQMLLFAGTLRRGQHVGAFFDSFGDVARRSERPVRLRMLGVVDRGIEELASAAIPPPLVEFMPPVEHRSAVAAMASAGALVVFTGGGGAAEATMTGKLYEYLAVRRPILLVGPEGPAAELVRSSGAGVAADPEDRAGLAAAINEVIRLAADPSFAGASSTILDRYDRRMLAKTWGALLDQVVRRDVDRPLTGPTTIPTEG